MPRFGFHGGRLRWRHVDSVPWRGPWRIGRRSHRPGRRRAIPGTISSPAGPTRASATDTSGAPRPGLASWGLTEREREVLARLAAGDSNKLIARAFELSPHTVKRYVANILGKLGADTRGQAAARWHGRDA